MGPKITPDIQKRMDDLRREGRGEQGIEIVPAETLEGKPESELEKIVPMDHCQIGVGPAGNFLKVVCHGTYQSNGKNREGITLNYPAARMTIPIYFLYAPPSPPAPPPPPPVDSSPGFGPANNWVFPPSAPPKAKPPKKPTEPNHCFLPLKPEEFVSCSGPQLIVGLQAEQFQDGSISSSSLYGFMWNGYRREAQTQERGKGFQWKPNGGFGRITVTSPYTLSGQYSTFTDAPWQIARWNVEREISEDYFPDAAGVCYKNPGQDLKVDPQLCRHTYKAIRENVVQYRGDPIETRHSFSRELFDIQISVGAGWYLNPHQRVLFSLAPYLGAKLSIDPSNRELAGAGLVLGALGGVDVGVWRSLTIGAKADLSGNVTHLKGPQELGGGTRTGLGLAGLVTAGFDFDVDRGRRRLPSPTPEVQTATPTPTGEEKVDPGRPTEKDPLPKPESTSPKPGEKKSPKTKKKEKIAPAATPPPAPPKKPESKPPVTEKDCLEVLPKVREALRAGKLPNDLMERIGLTRHIRERLYIEAKEVTKEDLGKKRRAIEGIGILPGSEYAFPAFKIWLDEVEREANSNARFGAVPGAQWAMVDRIFNQDLRADKQLPVLYPASRRRIDSVGGFSRAADFMSACEYSSARDQAARDLHNDLLGRYERLGDAEADLDKEKYSDEALWALLSRLSLKKRQEVILRAFHDCKGVKLEEDNMVARLIAEDLQNYQIERTIKNYEKMIAIQVLASALGPLGRGAQLAVRGIRAASAAYDSARELEDLERAETYQFAGLAEAMDPQERKALKVTAWLERIVPTHRLAGAGAGLARRMLVSGLSGSILSGIGAHSAGYDAKDTAWMAVSGGISGVTSAVTGAATEKLGKSVEGAVGKVFSLRPGETAQGFGILLRPFRRGQKVPAKEAELVAQVKKQDGTTETRRVPVTVTTTKDGKDTASVTVQPKGSGPLTVVVGRKNSAIAPVPPDCAPTKAAADGAGGTPPPAPPAPPSGGGGSGNSGGSGSSGSGGAGGPPKPPGGGGTPPKPPGGGGGDDGDGSDKDGKKEPPKDSTVRQREGQAGQVRKAKAADDPDTVTGATPFSWRSGNHSTPQDTPRLPREGDMKVIGFTVVSGRPKDGEGHSVYSVYVAKGAEEGFNGKPGHRVEIEKPDGNGGRVRVRVKDGTRGVTFSPEKGETLYIAGHKVEGPAPEAPAAPALPPGVTRLPTPPAGDQPGAEREGRVLPFPSTRAVTAPIRPPGRAVPPPMSDPAASIPAAPASAPTPAVPGVTPLVRPGADVRDRTPTAPMRTPDARQGRDLSPGSRPGGLPSAAREVRRGEAGGVTVQVLDTGHIVLTPPAGFNGTVRVGGRVVAPDATGKIIVNPGEGQIAVGTEILNPAQIQRPVRRIIRWKNEGRFRVPVYEDAPDTTGSPSPGVAARPFPPGVSQPTPAPAAVPPAEHQRPVQSTRPGVGVATPPPPITGSTRAPQATAQPAGPPAPASTPATKGPELQGGRKDTYQDRRGDGDLSIPRDQTLKPGRVFIYQPRDGQPAFTTVKEVKDGEVVLTMNGRDRRFKVVGERSPDVPKPELSVPGSGPKYPPPITKPKQVTLVEITDSPSPSPTPPGGPKSSSLPPPRLRDVAENQGRLEAQAQGATQNGMAPIPAGQRTNFPGTGPSGGVKGGGPQRIGSYGKGSKKDDGNDELQGYAAQKFKKDPGTLKTTEAGAKGGILVIAPGLRIAADPEKPGHRIVMVDTDFKGGEPRVELDGKVIPTTIVAGSWGTTVFVPPGAKLTINGRDYSSK